MKYTLEHGSITRTRDGQHLFSLVATMGGDAALPRAELDAFAQEIMAALNADETKLAEARAEGVREAENLDYEAGFADGANDADATLREACEAALHWLEAERDNPGEATPGAILETLRGALKITGETQRPEIMPLWPS